MVPTEDVQNPRTTEPSEFDWDKPVDLSKAPDLARVFEAWADADAYDMRFDKGDYDSGISHDLWKRANEVWAEEFGVVIPEEKVETLAAEDQLLNIAIILLKVEGEEDDWTEVEDPNDDWTIHADHR